MSRGRPTHAPVIALNRQMLERGGSPHERRSLVDCIFEMVAGEMRAGRLAAGQRMHSVRQLADDCEVSRDTVARAYDKLVAHGHLESRPGSGFFVKLKGQPARLRAESAAQAPLPDWWRFRLLQSPAGLASSTGLGSLPAEWLDEAALGKALRLVARSSARHLAGYNDPLGYLPLRQQLQARLHDIQIEAPAARIMVTAGASGAIHLLAQAYLRTAREHVLVDDPGPFLLRDRLMSVGLEMLAVPRDADGPNLDVLRALCERHRPRFYFCSSVLHNPMSSHLAPYKAYQILRLAEEFDFTIVEDDSYSDLMPPGAAAAVTRLASLDGLERVIYIGSLSKSIAPGLRVGFMCANAKVMEWLQVYRTVNEIAGSSVNERVAYQLLSQGGYRHHCAQLRSRLDECRRPVIEQLAALGCTFERQPDTGMYVWATLPGEVPALPLAEALFQEGHLTAPGDVFSPAPAHRAKMRFNIGRTLDSPALPALQRLLKAAPGR